MIFPSPYYTDFRKTFQQLPKITKDVPITSKKGEGFNHFDCSKRGGGGGAGIMERKALKERERDWGLIREIKVFKIMEKKFFYSLKWFTYHASPWSKEMKLQISCHIWLVVSS